MKQLPSETITLTKIVGGGQALGQLEDGRKVFVWGGLPGETVTVQLTKRKSSYAEGVVTEVIKPSPDRVTPRDPDSFMSTSPWQIVDFAREQAMKAQLIDETFELHGVTLPEPTQVYIDDIAYGYRNKVEFSWWGDSDENGNETLDLAFFRRGSKGKIPVQGTSLARDEINQLACTIRDTLHAASVSARSLKTIMIRCDQAGNCVWQLYVKDESFDTSALEHIPNGEVIYSDPRSPASRITKRLAKFGDTTLTDTLLKVPFRYACEGFFQVNVPVYEQALRDMSRFVMPESASELNLQTVDMYSGVGTIGLTVGSPGVTLVEIDEHAVREMRRNIDELGIDAAAVHASSETALEHITSDKTIIVDPPRAGLHSDVTERLLEVVPPRIIYLSCNPVTQARDIARLLSQYKIVHQQGYNFFPRTPHIEHLIVLDCQ